MEGGEGGCLTCCSGSRRFVSHPPISQPADHLVLFTQINPTLSLTCLPLLSTQDGQAKLSEIKGPRDRLSDSQRAWMHALTDVDVQVGLDDESPVLSGPNLNQCIQGSGKPNVMTSFDGPCLVAFLHAG